MYSRAAHSASLVDFFAPIRLVDLFAGLQLAKMSLVRYYL